VSERRKVRKTPRAPRRVIAPPPRLDRREDSPTEIFDIVSGPFERRVEPAPLGAHRRR
jgi:hypothetical protein